MILLLFTGAVNSGWYPHHGAQYGGRFHHAGQQGAVCGRSPARHQTGAGDHRHQLLQRMLEKGLSTQNTCNERKITFYLQVLFVLFLISFRVAQLVEGQASNLWVARSNHAILLFISFVEFYKWIFGAIVIDFDIFKTAWL